MIEFLTPQVGMAVSRYMELVTLWEACSTCAGFCISLGKKFFTQGVQEIDSDICPAIAAAISQDISPRVIPSYATLLWFGMQVSLLNSLRPLFIVCLIVSYTPPASKILTVRELAIMPLPPYHACADSQRLCDHKDVALQLCCFV